MAWDVLYPSSFLANSNWNLDEYLAPWVKVSIHQAYSDNSRIPRTQLSFQDEENKNSYTRTFEWNCELWAKWELVFTNPIGDRILLEDAFPGASSWILWESPVSKVSTQTSAEILELTQTPLAQTA